MGVDLGPSHLHRLSNSYSSWPDADPAKALAPIQRLVLGAFVSAICAAMALFLSVMHVMSTTDTLSMTEERVRAARIADILPHVPQADLERAIEALGVVAGLDGLVITPVPTSEPYHQSIPLLAEPRGGEFLTWSSARPGLYLLQTHAPVRVPLIVSLIACVLGFLLAMLRHVRHIESQRILAQRQAMRDHLTGLPNRLALESELSRLVGAQQAFSVVALDLDRFKPVNDLFGHHAGDLALIEVARRLSAQLRTGEFLARIGGDEFVAIVQRGGQRDMLAQLARDCITAVSRPLHVVGQNVAVGVSLGIVDSGLDHPAKALLKQADRALYDAKRGDGGAFCFAGEASVRLRDLPVVPVERPLLVRA